MLDSLRRHASGWVAKTLLALLIVSFAIWGIGDVVRGAVTTDKVASVGARTIRVPEFNVAYERMITGLQRQYRQTISRQQAAQAGIPQQVLSQLVTEAALDDRTHALRLGLSDAELVRQIQTDPSFKDANGNFSRSALQQVLRDNGWSEDQYVVTRRNAATRDLLIGSLMGGVAPPQTLLEIVSRHDGEERILDYIAITKDSIGGIDDPSDEVLKAFFEPRKGAFRAPEYRSVTLMTATVETLAEAEDVTEDDLKQSYDKEAARYTRPEQRRIQRISFTDKAKAEAADAKVKAGMSFEALAAEMNLKPEDTDLGLLARERVLDTLLAEAAFKLDLNQVSGVVQARFGYVIVRVSEIIAGGKTPFEQAKPDIRKTIALARAQDRIGHMRNEVEDARAAGGSLSEVAAKLKLPKQDIAAVDKQGLKPDGEPVGELPKAADFLSKVFETDVKVETDPLQIGGRGFTWYEVTAITPARDRTFEEAQKQVLAQYKIEETAKAINDRATAALEKLKAGGVFAEIAAENFLAVTTTEKLTRTSQSQDLGAAVLNAAFLVPEGAAGRSIGPDGAAIVFVVRDVTTPAFFAEAPEVAAKRDRLRQELENSLLDEYLKKIQADMGVTVDQANLARALGLGSGN